MPRNAAGVYSLPAGNPVVSGTLIESTWANPTMSDIANALTESLPRNGSAPMTGPLILAGNATRPLEAVPLQQLEATVGSSNSYLPAGAIQLFAMQAIPTGWLECNGAAISRTTYANLFATIGTTYGAGNGTTTFNLPDLRGLFVRGWDNGRNTDPGRAFATVQAAANNPHTHTPTVTNPAHSHALIDPGHTHGVNDPGHSHVNQVMNGAAATFGWGLGTAVNSAATGAAATGISLNAAASGVSINAAAQATSVSIASEGVEARPINIALVYCIKAFGALQTDGLGSMAFQNKDAVNITGGSGVFTTLQCTTTPTQPNDVARLADIGGSLSAVLSSDPQVLLVDNTTPSTPILRPQTNVPNGMVKLDSAGYVPANVLNITDMTYLGAWDAAPGLLPTGTFATGDYYEIDVAGTLTLNTSGGSVAQPCNVGDAIIYNDATPGWWYSPAPTASSLPASAIAFTPSGTIGATNVQAAIAELDGETQTALAGKAAVGASYTKVESDANFLQVGGGNKLTAPLKFSDDSTQASAAQPILTGPRKTVLSAGSTGNFTVPANVTRLLVTACGGGGGGAAYVTGGAQGGSGGGGAGAVIGAVVAVTPGQVIPYSVGVGGGGSQTVGVAGSPGGPTTFENITCVGGGGGSPGGSPGSGGGVTGAANGAYSGMSGQQYNYDGQAYAQGGGGGASVLGAGGYPGAASEGPRIGMLGGGGGGGKQQGGGAGGGGILIIEW